MQVLLNKSLQALTRDPTESSHENIVVYSLQPIMNKYACPCCSYTLLRHASLEGTYWLCNHCYQKMPVYQPLQKLTLALTTNSRSVLSEAEVSLIQ